MIIEEMHIGVDMELQKVSTYTQRNLEPEEIDWFLNNEVTKFIKQRTNPHSNMKQQGTDSTTKRYEDLSDLTTIKDLDVELNADKTVGTCILPEDYYAYISSKLNVDQLCEGVTTVTKTEPLYKCVFPLSFPTGEVLSEYVIGLNISGNISEIFRLTTSLPTGYIENVDIDKQRFMLLKGLKILLPETLDNLNSSEYSLYWERYKDEFHNNSFILVSKSAFFNVDVTINTSPTSNYSISQLNPTLLNQNSVLWSRTRLIEDEAQFEVEHSHLSGSRPDSPVVMLKQGILTFDFPESTIGKTLKLMYVSKPTILDLALKKNLNMKDTLCKEIVSNTVRFLKGVFKGDYQTYLNENVMIE